MRGRHLSCQRCSGGDVSFDKRGKTVVASIGNSSGLLFIYLSEFAWPAAEFGLLMSRFVNRWRRGVHHQSQLQLGYGFLMIKRRFSLMAAIVASLVSAANVARAQSNWTDALADGNFNDAANWDAGLPTATIGLLHEIGSHSPVMDLNFSTRALIIDEDALTPYTITGTGQFTISQAGFGGAGGYIGSASDADLTVDVAQLNMTRSNSFVTGDYTIDSLNRGNGDLIIGSSVGGTMLLKYTGTSSHNPGAYAHNGDLNTGTTITIYPKLDFSGVTSTTSANNYTSGPDAGCVVQLLGGITGGATPTAGNPSKRFHTEGEAGGKTILGDSTGWLGVAQAIISDLEINSSNSLGDAGSAASGYTEIAFGAATSALLLNKGSGPDISSGEYIFIYGRDTASFPTPLTFMRRSF